MELERCNLIESDKDVAVTVKLISKLDKKDIGLRVTEIDVAIQTYNLQQKFHKVITFPSKVIPKTSRVTFKDGILDIIVKKNISGKIIKPKHTGWEYN